ncbi:hypothetical protein LCGC14_1115670, partial [marine sediment metagenome]
MVEYVRSANITISYEIDTNKQTYREEKVLDNALSMEEIKKGLQEIIDEFQDIL